jgi:hypothetical protein
MNLILDALPIGATTTEFLQALTQSNLAVKRLSLFTSKHPPALQNRLNLTPEESEIIAGAMRIRESLALPFWESVMLNLFENPSSSERLIAEATYHQNHRNSAFWLSRDEILGGALPEITKTTDSSHMVSFSSLIDIGKGGNFHLPLIDFHCRESDANDFLIKAVCKQLFDSETFVFASGKSYHAIGIEILDDSSFRHFLAKSLLFSPIVDTRYVAHQLLEGACALRLSSSALKPSDPRLKWKSTGSSVSNG